MLTKHYDSRGGVSLICSECGTVSPVYRRQTAEAARDQGADLFAMYSGVTAASHPGTLGTPYAMQTGEDRPRYIGSNEEAYARKTDPETSREAAARVTPILNVLEAAVDAAVFAAGERGATAAEVHEATGIDLQSITPRFKPLERKGRIVRTSERRDGRYVWIAAEWAQVRAA